MYQIGKIYPVHVAILKDTSWVKHQFGMVRQLPVLLPCHDDREIIGIAERHYHHHVEFTPKNIAEVWHTVGAYFILESDVERIETQRRKCLRKYAYPNYIQEQNRGRVEWMPQLKEHYKGQHLRNGHICPHRGADLNQVQPDKYGCRTCPMHGLIFNADGVCIGNDFTFSLDGKIIPSPAPPPAVGLKSKP